MKSTHKVETTDAPLDRKATLAAISAASLDAVVAVDHDGTIIGWNGLAETYFGWTEIEALGRSIHELIIPERDRAAHVAGLARYVSGRRSQIFGRRFERAALRVDGSEIPIELSIMCVAGGDEDLLVCFIRDLSEHYRAQAALEELQLRLVHVSRISAMGTMAATLAHELNQPLSAANNYLAGAARLLEKAHQPELNEALFGVQQGREAVSRAAETIRSVRDMAGKKPRGAKPYLLRDLLQDAVRLLGADLVVKLKVDVCPSADGVLADKVQIEQVLINLLRNGSEALAGHPRPELRVTATRQGERVTICVADNGPGIPVGRVDGLFSPISSEKADGMGMGLSICRTLVDQNGGSIWAELGGPGATICFTVPAIKPTADS